MLKNKSIEFPEHFELEDYLDTHWFIRLQTRIYSEEGDLIVHVQEFYLFLFTRKQVKTRPNTP